jgi:hypothetical protein
MNQSTKHIHCIGCGAEVPDIDGPSFRYPDAASPGCWAIYGEILAKEYGAFQHPPIHRLTVDAYAVQHPGRPTPQTIQSVTGHLISLCSVLERGYEFAKATEMMRSAIARFKGAFVWLEPPASFGRITVLDVVKAQNLSDHIKHVEQWANEVWEAWKAHHDTIQYWIDRLQDGRVNAPPIHTSSWSSR